MPRVWGLIVTYRRPNALRTMLEALHQQSLTLDGVWVVDNGTDDETRQIVEALQAHYVRSGNNLGPAGGIALGMQQVLRAASDDDWLVLFDDDDPPPFDTLVADLIRFGALMTHRDSRTAAVGAMGAPYNRNLGIWRRLSDDELQGAVPVDVIHGGRFPCYCVHVLRAGLVFDKDLFFGFEEGEFGLRLRKRGYSLYIDGSLALRLRTILGQTGPAPGLARTAAGKAARRRYYGVRNSVILARRYGAFWTPPLVAVGGALKGVRSLVRSGRPWHEIVLPLRGAADGLRGRMGRTINPARSTK